MRAFNHIPVAMGRQLLRRKLTQAVTPPRCQSKAYISMRTIHKSKEVVAEKDLEYPRKIFSGIQPTGALHLGNYLGAVQNWTKLQCAKEDVTFCIVDMHSITVPQDPVTLRENIFQMTAAMLACGIEPERSTLFLQSSVKEHTELCWILGCQTTMARLGHLPQYKEKLRVSKEVPLGLFVYPVLQAADILLYKATHVPVGEDQLQHIQLAQHLARTFNSKFGPTFPICHAIIEQKDAARIRSLRDPGKKMSKSDKDPRATINLTDEPEVIVEKIKKSVTDFCSDVNYRPDTRPGVSNLIAVHSLLSGKSIKEIERESADLDTGKYKAIVADVVVEHLRPIRNKILQHLKRRNELTYLLELGAEKARAIAQETMADVIQRSGLGSHPVMPAPLQQREEPQVQVRPAEPVKVEEKKKDKFDRPEVPRQELRVEKKRQLRIEIKPETKIDLIGPQGVLNVKPVVVSAKNLSYASEDPGTDDPSGDSATSEKQQKEIKL